MFVIVLDSWLIDCLHVFEFVSFLPSGSSQAIACITGSSQALACIIVYGVSPPRVGCVRSGLWALGRLLRALLRVRGGA